MPEGTILRGENLAEWEVELILGLVNQNGGVGWSIRDPLFIEQPSPEEHYEESEV